MAKHKLLFYNKLPKNDGDFYIERLIKIKNGNKRELNEFIDEYKPFIISIVKKNIHYSGSITDCDEYSIALIAFYEAIMSFETTKSTNFFRFAEIVIKRRLIDYFRSNSKGFKEYPLSYFDNEVQIDMFKNRKEDPNTKRIEIVEELNHLKKVLKKFSIDIYRLPEYVPQYANSIKLSISIARIIIKSNELMSYLLRNKKIPYKEVLKYTNVTRKTISKYRKYIMLICLIHTNGFDYLRSFIDIDRIEGELYEK